MKPVLIEDIGMRYAKLDSKRKARYGKYYCHLCGNKFIALISNIKFGQTKSCGCYRNSLVANLNKKHGFSKTRIWSIWHGMRCRCLDKNDKNYGGRGISVCKEWENDFLVFYEWAKKNGYKGTLQIDRIDGNKHYSPSNCRFVTVSQNIHNIGLRTTNSSGYKGVTYSKDGKRKKRWMACITVNYKHYYLGRYSNKKDALMAYNKKAMELVGDCVWLSEIKDEDI